MKRIILVTSFVLAASGGVWIRAQYTTQEAGRSAPQAERPNNEGMKHALAW